MSKWKWQLIVALAFALVTMGLAACGDDKPATPPAGKKQAGKEAAKDEPAKKEAAGPAAESGEAQPSTEAGEQGKDEAGKNEADTPAEEKPTPEESAREKAEQLADRVQLDRTLKKVTAYGVTGPLQKSMDRAIAMLPEKVRPMAQLAAPEALKKLAAEAQFKSMDWIDMGRGIGFAFEGKDKPLVAIPIKSTEAFVAALPEGLAADVNNGYELAGSYAMPYGKYVFLSDSFRTIDIIEGDLKLELTRLETDSLFLLVLGGPSLKTLASSALDEMERSLGETMPMQQEQKEFLAKLFNFMKELLGEIEEIRVTADLDGDNLSFRMSLTTIEGSRLEQSLAALRPGTFANAGYLPAKSYLVMAQNMPAEAATPYMNRYVDLVATAWKLKDEERGDFAKMYARLLGSFGPDSAFAMYSDSSFPVAMTSVAQARDGLQARDQVYAFYALVLNKVVEELPPEQKQIFASGNLKQVVDSFAPVLQNLGVSVNMNTEDYRGAKVDYLVLTFDWAKLSLPPSAAWVSQIIRSRLGGALGFSKDRMVFTFGPNPIVRAKEVLDQTPGLKLVEMAGPGVEENKYTMVMALSFERLMNAVLEIGVVASLIGNEPWVEKVRSMQALLVTSGVDKKEMWVESTLGLKSLLHAFEAEMLEGMGLEGSAGSKAVPAPETKPEAARVEPAAEAPAAEAAAPAAAQ